jgi:hypothetical protein
MSETGLSLPDLDEVEVAGIDQQPGGCAQAAPKPEGSIKITIHVPF